MAASKEISTNWSKSGETIYCIIRRDLDGFTLNDASGAFASSPVDPYNELTEDSIIKGLYELSESRTVWNDGKYTVVIYKQAGGSPTPVSDLTVTGGIMTLVSDIVISLDASVDSVLDDLDIMKNKDGSKTYNQTTDSLEALSESVTSSSRVLVDAVISERVDTLFDINKAQKLTVDTTTTLQYQWKDSDGDPVNITGLVLNFKAVKDAGESPAAIPEITGTILDAVNGIWYFEVTPTTVFNGRYEIYAVDGAIITALTKAGGSNIETFPRL